MVVGYFQDCFGGCFCVERQCFVYMGVDGFLSGGYIQMVQFVVNWVVWIDLIENNIGVCYCWLVIVKVIGGWFWFGVCVFWVDV